MKTLLKNGLLVDPRNRVQARLNLLLEGGRVAAVTKAEPAADRVIDAAGMVVVPGFLDIHMHEDFIGADGRLEDDDKKAIFKCMLRMGVTTVLGGECGINRYDPARYLDIVDRDGAAVNVALLAGHAFIREACGHADKYTPASPEERAAMARMLEKELDAGCFGVSYGLRYTPGIDAAELRETARVCVPRHKFIAAHVRDDAAAIFFGRPGISGRRPGAGTAGAVFPYRFHGGLWPDGRVSCLYRGIPHERAGCQL